MEVRDIDFTKEENLTLDSILNNLDDKKINSICRAITNEKKDYAGDILGEEGALEVISDFLLSIISSYEKSKNFKMLIQKFMSPKIQEILEKVKTTVK